MGRTRNPCPGAGQRAVMRPDGLGEQCSVCGMWIIPYPNGIVRHHGVLGGGAPVLRGSPPERPPARSLAVDPSAQPQERRQRAADSPSDPDLGAALWRLPLDFPQIVDRLENYYDFECTGGPLKNCVEWQHLREVLGRLLLERQAQKEGDGLREARWADLFAMVQRAQANIPGASEQALVAVRFIAEDLHQATGDLLAALAEAQADVARLRHLAHQLEWLAHKPFCAVMNQDARFGWRAGDEAVCTCGLAAALTEPPA